MHILQKLAAVGVAFCLAANLTDAGMSPVGIIVQAKQAYLGSGSASEGTTLYEGDSVSTGTDGRLAIQSAGAMLQLEARGGLVLRSGGSNERALAVELLAGTLVFSVRQAGMEVRTQQATIRPVAETLTIAHVRVVGPRELRLYARRGAVEFAYRDQKERVSEGRCYRILLAGEEENKDTNASASTPKKQPAGVRPFVLIGIAVGASLAAGLRHHPHPHPRPHESPEDP